MFQFDENLESVFAQCVPFDKSPLRYSEDYLHTAQTLQAVRQLLDRHAPGSTVDIDSYLDTYLELVDLECRHYFMEGFQLGQTTSSN